jgi:hypothetical protein
MKHIKSFLPSQVNRGHTREEGNVGGGGGRGVKFNVSCIIHDTILPGRPSFKYRCSYMKSNVCTIVPWSCGLERIAYMMYRKQGYEAAESGNRAKQQRQETGPGSRVIKQG